MGLKVTLVFRSIAEKEHVIAQLFDGWGSNEVNIRHTEQADVFTMVPADDVWREDNPSRDCEKCNGTGVIITDGTLVSGDFDEEECDACNGYGDDPVA